MTKRIDLSLLRSTTSVKNLISSTGTIETPRSWDLIKTLFKGEREHNTLNSTNTTKQY